jgi:ubiquinone/menaquinone biosynthesis C-methylase UbiE
MKQHTDFWDKNAGRYDRFMRKDAAAYVQLYELLRPAVRHKAVLELATGTGLIAKNIVNSAVHIEATDASPEMIAEAKRDNCSAKLHFSVQDMFHLPYADESFDAIIVANALHIVPEPEKALPEIRRVLKDDGILIAPTFTHADNSFLGKGKAFFMKLAGFPLHSKWTSAEYLDFLRENGWTVQKSTVLKASFPLTYAECVKSEG